VKGFFISISLVLATFCSYAGTLPTWEADLGFSQNGSCELANLSFNASRFNKINLNKKRNDMDVYLQVILFLKENNQAIYRSQEVGLIECKETTEGPICSYFPFNDTKVFIKTTWSVTDEILSVSKLGDIKKIRDDFPWLGYELTISNDFIVETAHGNQSIGGKIELNFNDTGRSASRICREGIL
jgi:hypothetical protein